MKAILSSMIQNALARAVAQGALRPFDIPSFIVFEVPKFETHGDFSTNMAMTMASEQKKSPRQIAAVIVDSIEDGQGLLAKMEIAGPGFINFFIKPEKWLDVLRSIHVMQDAYGTSQIGKGKRVQVEFVSANPTGPLHVGHGRCAAVGDTLAAVLTAAGFDVEREYYINDSGRQIATLGKSVFFRYRQLHGESVPFPEDAYQGDYIKDLARELSDKHGAALLEMQEQEALEKCARYAADSILAGIEDDLKAFNVTFNTWFSEQSLFDRGDVQKAIESLKGRDIVYEKDGALWFRTTAFGDEKDRVVVRGNGLTTYFAADIAYHKNKLDRKYDRVIDVWGADHHGYIPRVSAAVQALGGASEFIGFVLVQLVNLLREGKPVAMSTRSGEFVTLREVIDEVGCDAARFIFLLRDYDSPLDFDLELAKKQSNENPVYYVQYVHARICNILRKAKERGYQDMMWQDSFPQLLHLPEETALIRLMERYPEVVAQSARLLEPHRIPFYLRELAAAFHAYYHDRDKHKVVSDDTGLSMARLYLVSALGLVIRNGLRLMGVSAPEVM